MKNIKALAAIAALAIGSGVRAGAAIQLTYVAADSNVGAGVYAFDLTGVPTSPTPTYNSDFELEYFSTIGNTVTLSSDGAPTGWNPGIYNTSVAEWYFQNTSLLVNGIFEVQASPNLNVNGGMIFWDYADSGNNENVSGFVGVPEPTSMAEFAGLSALGLCSVGWLRKKYAALS
jgi:hypothetical protein